MQVTISSTKQLPTVYWRRHLTNLVRYGSPRKYANLCGAYFSYLRGKETVSSMPAFLKVEISRYCDVGCTFCCSSWHPIKKPAFYPFHKYKQIIDQFKDYAFLVSLYDVGEPLHHPDVLQCIDYAHQRRLGTVISSSLSIERSDQFWRDFVASGLDYLIVAVDGVTAEVYNQHRTKGKLDLVIDNLKRVLALKTRHRSPLFIEWQMLDLPWNRVEQPAAQKMAEELGCDRFQLIAEATQTRLRYDAENRLRNRNCLLPYILLFVTFRNDVRLCYKVYHHDMRVGSLSRSSFAEIWNGEEIKRMRNRNKICCREGCKTCQE